MIPRRGRAIAAIAALLTVPLAPPDAAAQSAPPVLLQLRPKPGDLLRLRLDQIIEMSAGDTEGEPPISATDVTSLVMQVRLAVESVDIEGATMLAVTDSVRIESKDANESPTLRSARALQGQRFRFRVAPDGSTMVTGADAWAGPAVGSLLSQLPATLPREAVTPGSSWNRSVEIPLAAAPDGRANATLTATFRFDSLSRSGEFAYLSMRGRLQRSGPLQGSSVGGFVQTSGTVNGNILIDRRRGWITEARTVISLRSLVSAEGRDAAPTRVRMKITQWMRVM